MNENYIVINGKKTELTEEQMKALGIKLRKNPFERVAELEVYYYVDAFNDVQCISDDADQADDMSFECSNYFNDYSFANQVALHQLLYRKLLKFAYDNGFEDATEWDGVNHHCSIHCDMHKKTFNVSPLSNTKYLEVYFSSEEGAERAIKEVIEPFMKEHPEFVW